MPTLKISKTNLSLISQYEQGRKEFLDKAKEIETHRNNLITAIMDASGFEGKTITITGITEDGIQYELGGGQSSRPELVKEISPPSTEISPPSKD